ncbi:MAG: hypothetical protein LBE49_07340 [Deltaproteobacteria bacterium]|jgi:DNA-binding transcriptional regulator YiaG|nr:hypothetical protein [Deltaproteobacteria bacterium]
MPKIAMHHADHYLIQHELDLQDSNDLKWPGIVERDISPEAVKSLRNCLNLNLEMFALLLGINLTAMLRYESLSVPPFPQGNVSRKLSLLSAWLSDAASAAYIHEMMGQEGGLSTLSGILQSESVSSYLELAKIHERFGVEDEESGLPLAKACGQA